MGEHGLFGNLFLSIGAMKAGTTWLYTVLSRHPALHFSPEKEIHYFYHRYVDPGLLTEQRRLQNARDRYLFRFDPQNANIDRIRENLHWVSQYLSRPVDDFWFRNLFHLRPQQVYACDFSNLAAHLPSDAWPQIADSCDRLRVLYTMRDPVRRLWSHTKFHLQVSNQIDRLGTWAPEDYAHFLRQPHIWPNAEYGRVLRRLRKGLPEGTWKAIFYEDLHVDQRGMLASIEDFLGIPHHAYPEAVLGQRPTESVAHPMPAFFPGLVAEDVARIRAEVEAEGLTPPASWGSGGQPASRSR